MISSAWLLAIYCVLVLIASLAGGWLLLFIHLTHTRLQIAISFVAGLMLGIALLHSLPDAGEQLHSFDRAAYWVLGGFLTMFFVQRFFHFHHHDLPEGDPDNCCWMNLSTNTITIMIMDIAMIMSIMPLHLPKIGATAFMGGHGFRINPAFLAGRAGAGGGG